MINPTLRDCIRDFKVVAKSENTNSFGLYQMVLVSKDGKAFKTCASYMNVKQEGEIVKQHFTFNKEGKEVGHYFPGCELTESIEAPPADVLQEIWKENAVQS